jgi:hypothetical protein
MNRAKEKGEVHIGASYQSVKKSTGSDG